MKNDSDSFIKFWFIFVYPLKGQLEIDHQRPALDHLEQHYVDTFLSFVFEDLCRDLFLYHCRRGTINFSPSKVGAYWDGESDSEIDLVALDEDKKQAFFGECKYHETQPIDLRVYSALLQKSKATVFNDYEHFFILFSVSGFDQRLLDISNNNNNLFLVDKGRVILT